MRCVYSLCTCFYICLQIYGDTYINYKFCSLKSNFDFATNYKLLLLLTLSFLSRGIEDTIFVTIMMSRVFFFFEKHDV